MKKLTKIKLINWHYLNNETIDIKDNVLLTGPNATGKSTILDAISFVVTAGETAFNLAANEKGKRDLRGYVKCKIGTDEKEYLRDGDVTGHVCLEFFDESLEKYTTVGAVIDAFGDLMPVKVVFYEVDSQISDEWFTDEKGMILGTVDFRKKNDFTYYLTKKEARRGFKIAYGSINDDFFKLIHKALAFKPISDVKDFIYQNILEEKQIDISNIIDSIRSYKELENTLKVIKVKIADLKVMDEIYQEIKSIEKTKNYYNYLLRLFDQEKLVNDSKTAGNKIEELEVKKSIKNNEYKKIEQEIESLQERSKELYSMLSNNEEFKASEYLDKQIAKTKSNILELEGTKDNYIKKISDIKEQVNSLRRLNNRKVYTKLANLQLSNVTEVTTEATKLDLIAIDRELKEVIALCNQDLGKFNSKREEILVGINEVRQSIENLKGNNLRYNSALIAIRNEIAGGLKRLYGTDISVHIFSELLEITNPTWHDTIEIYLGNRRFDLIVEPRYFDAALQIFSRIKNNYRLYGVGLVNTKQITKYNSFTANSLASIITSENVDAQRYINMTLGNVIMCNSEQELEKYPTSVTNNGLSYSRFTVRSLNPNIDKPFIGKGALSEQTQQVTETGVRLKEEYLTITESINNLTNELTVLSTLDIKSVLLDLDNASNLIKEQNFLEDLIQKRSREKNVTAIELQEEYNNIDISLKNADIKKGEINQEIGSIINSIRNYEELIVNARNVIDASANELKELIDNDFELEAKAKKEYEEINSTIGVDKAIIDFKKRLLREEENYQNISEGLMSKQFSYINTHNSMLSVGLTEMSKYLAELNKLERSELISYEQKVRSAREAAEVIFKEDFLSKLRNNIMTAENEISKINETLKNIKFGNDTYEFIFPKSKDYSVFYEMVTADFNQNSPSLFTFDFQNKYQQQLEELFANLAIDETNSKGAINKFTDYRTYMDYDIRITNQNGETMTYSKVFKEKSGGETQVPFYVAILASFVRVYTKSKFMTGDTIGLVLFDEVFDKMDSNRMRAMMSFISSMPLQVIVACPPQRMSLLEEYTNTTLAMLRKGTRSQVIPILKKGSNDVENANRGE